MPKQSYLADVMAGIDAQIAELRAQGVEEEDPWAAITPESIAASKWAAAEPEPVRPAPADEPRPSGPQLRQIATPEELARMKKERTEREARLQLERRMVFLTNLRRELDSDPQLVSFIDSMVGNQVKAAERR